LAIQLGDKTVTHTNQYQDSPQAVHNNWPEVVEGANAPEIDHGQHRCSPNQAQHPHYAQTPPYPVQEKQQNGLETVSEDAPARETRRRGIMVPWILIALIGLIVIGAVVGGAVGGTAAVRSKKCSLVASSSNGTASDNNGTATM
jgi:hypothetical protein